jgi:hypothetical protein
MRQARQLVDLDGPNANQLEQRFYPQPLQCRIGRFNRILLAPARVVNQHDISRSLLANDLRLL